MKIEFTRCIRFISGNSHAKKSHYKTVIDVSYRQGKPTIAGPRSNWPALPNRRVSSPVVLALVLTLVSLVVYSPLFFAGFQEDDFAILNAVAHRGPFGFATSHGAGYFSPLTSLSFWIQYQLFGLHPFAYRVFDDLIHAGCATLCALIAECLMPRRNLLPWLSGFLFLLLPSHGEAINWIAARGHLMAAFFGLSAILLFLINLKSGDRRLIIWTCSGLAAGLVSNSSIVWVPVAMGAVLLWSRRDASWAFVCALVATTVGCVGGRLWLTGSVIDGMKDRSFGPSLLFGSLIQMCRSILPSLPSADVRLTNSSFLRSGEGLLIFAAGLFLFGLAMWSVRKRIGLDNSFGFFALTTASYLAIGGVFVHLPFPFSERFIYFPSAFSCIGIAIAIVGGRERFVLPLAILSIGAAGSVTLIENHNWQIAADLSDRLVRSFSRDVLPHVGKSVFLASEPATVNGAEALGFQFESVANLYGNKRLTVRTGGIEDVLSAGNRTVASQDKRGTSIRSLDDHAVYDAGATGFGDQHPSQSQLDRAGLVRFGLHEIELKPTSEPTYYWNGDRFVRINLSSSAR